MTQRIHDKIRKIIENTPGLTQKGLAERMDLNPAAVNRMLYGRRNIMAEEIPMIEDYLGVRLDLVHSPVLSANFEYVQPQAAASVRRGFSEAPPCELNGTQQMIPVYGYAPRALQKRLNLSEPIIADWAPRHPSLFGIANAFALYVFSDTMEPRYFQGELVYTHPGRPAEAGRDCLIEMQNGDAQLVRYLGQDGTHIRTLQFNPRTEKSIPKVDVKSIYAVVGRG